jgi:hypothetical protein
MLKMALPVALLLTDFLDCVSTVPALHIPQFGVLVNSVLALEISREDQSIANWSHLVILCQTTNAMQQQSQHQANLVEVILLVFF